MKHLAIRLRSAMGKDCPEPSKANRASMEEALADLVNAMWPTGTRAAVRREFGLRDNDARRVIEGRASKRQIMEILRHPNGKWAVGLYLMARVIGEDLEPYLQQEAEIEAREQERVTRLSRVHSRIAHIAA